MDTLTFLLLITCVTSNIYLIFRILDIEREIEIIRNLISHHISVMKDQSDLIQENILVIRKQIDSQSARLSAFFQPRVKPKKGDSLQRKSKSKKQQLLSYIEGKENFTFKEVMSSFNSTDRNDRIYFSKLLNDFVKEKRIKRVSYGVYAHT